MLFHRGSSVRVWCMVTVSILGAMEWCTRSVPISYMYSSFVLSLVLAYVGKKQEIAQQWDPIMIWDTADYQLFKMYAVTMKNQWKYMKRGKKDQFKNKEWSILIHLIIMLDTFQVEFCQMYYKCTWRVFSYNYWKYFLLLNDIFLL